MIGIMSPVWDCQYQRVPVDAVPALLTSGISLNQTPYAFGGGLNTFERRAMNGVIQWQT